MMINFEQARLNMVNSQLRTNKVTHHGVLEAFETIAREEYVPESAKGVAYVDEDLPVGQGRYLMEPMVLARMLQTADPQPGDAVLVIGAATGYAASVTAKLASTVVAIEEDDSFVSAMNDAFARQGVENAVAVKAPLAEGYPKQAPYNVIIFCGSVAEVPEAIADQLAEGGRLIAPVRDPRINGAQALGHVVLMEKLGGKVSSKTQFDANTPLLPGFEPKAEFKF